MKSHHRLWPGLACLGWALAAPGAWAETHALLMSIGDYQEPRIRLPGISDDMKRAREMALRLGVGADHITALQDDALSLSGMKQAFDKLVAQAGQGDSVFVYYSGHGDRKAREGECSEALVSYEKKHLWSDELEAHLGDLKDKIGGDGKLLVFLDSCFSGGVATRGFSKTVVPKALNDGPRCEKNGGLSRDLRPTGPARHAFAYIAAARDDEVAIASENGSWATQAWSRCLDEIPGSPGALPSIEALRACAQGHVDHMAEAAGSPLAPHITLHGDAGAAFDLAAAGSSATVAPPVATASDPLDPAATLRDLYQGRAAKQSVTATLDKHALRINQDWLNFQVAASQAGYVYVLMAGSGGDLHLLFPNERDQDNRIAVGETLELPRESWRIQASGPAGRDRLLVLVTPKRADFAALAAGRAGPFATLDGQEATHGLRRVLGEGGYGAALLEVEETP